MVGHKKENKNKQIPKKIKSFKFMVVPMTPKVKKKKEEISLDAGNYLQKTVAIALLAHASNARVIGGDKGGCGMLSSSYQKSVNFFLAV